MTGLTSSCGALEFECPGSVRLTVSTGTSPQFDWEPDCEATALWVKDTKSGEAAWVVEGRFRPPVIYGVAPKGAKELTRMKPLQSGASYQVEVIGAGPYGIHTKGDRTFRVH